LRGWVQLGENCDKVNSFLLGTKKAPFFKGGYL